MDKELLKRYMQAMSETGTLQGKVPVSHDGKGYDVSLKLERSNVVRQSSKYLKGGVDKTESFRASVMPMEGLAKLVRSASGTVEEVVSQLEEQIKYIEQSNASRARNAEKQN